MDDSWSSQAPVEPATGRHRMDLRAGPLSVGAVWAALPASRREAAHDYFAQDRLTHRFRRGRAYLAVLQGHQDAYHVYCEEGADVWQVGCTCGRRMPCAHVGALLFAVAGDPAQFRAWSPAARHWQAEADWAWDWARGASFPWAALSANQPLADAPPAEGVSVPAPLADLAHVPTRQLSDALATVVRTAHPGWWEQPLFLEALAAGFARLGRMPLDPAAQVAWIRRLAEEPRIPVAPALAAGGAPHPAVAAAWRSTLWELASAHALDPRPSHALAARALWGLAPIAATAADMRDQFSWAWPDGPSRAEWLLTEGRAAEAWWHLARSRAAAPDPFRPAARDPYRSATQQLAKTLITGEGPPVTRRGAPGPQ